MTDPAAVSLEAVFDAIPVGLGVVDPDRRIVLMNRAFRDSLGLPPDAFPPGISVEDAVRASAQRGVYGPGDPDQQVSAIMATDHGQTGGLRRRTFGGRSFDLYNSPMPDGFYVVSAIETTTLLTARAEAEAALAQTTNALISTRIGLAVFDARRLLIFANPRFAALLAIQPDRLVAGVGFEAVLTLMEQRDEYAGPDGAAFIRDLHQAAFRASATIRRRRGDGRSIDVMFDPLPDGGTTIVVHDVTSQAQAEDDAGRRARLLDLVLLNVPHGICVYGPDRRVAMFNDTYNKVMDGAPLRVGDSQDDVIRRRAEAGEYGDGDPETMIAAQVAYHATRPLVRRRIRPNGTAIDIRLAPLPDGGFISVVTDVTALVLAETALRQRAEDMSTMLGNIRHGILLWGADARLVASNPVAAELLSLPPEVLMPGRAEAEVIWAVSERGHFGSKDEFARLAREIQGLDRSVPYAREVVTGSGEILFIQSAPAPGGGWVTTLTDITRMRETENELRRAKDLAEAANDAKSRFLATMSHELRTPLNLIIGFSETMARARGAVSPAQVVEFSNEIHDAGRQLLSLINVILDVARIETGRIEPSGDVIDVAKAVQAALRPIEGEALAGEITVRVAVPAELPFIRADERRIVHALCQVLSNAVKFTAAGGSVTIEAGVTDNGGVVLAVTDSGIGIPAADQEKVFEPFTQIDSSLGRRYAGAGLGLFLARAIVTAHGGTLGLTSQVNKGTTVRMVFPPERVVAGTLGMRGTGGGALPATR